MVLEFITESARRERSAMIAPSANNGYRKICAPPLCRSQPFLSRHYRFSRIPNRLAEGAASVLSQRNLGIAVGRCRLCEWYDDRDFVPNGQAWQIRTSRTYPPAIQTAFGSCL